MISCSCLVCRLPFLLWLSFLGIVIFSFVVFDVCVLCCVRPLVCACFGSGFSCVVYCLCVFRVLVL